MSFSFIVVIGELAAGHVADVQLNACRGCALQMGRVAHRIAAPRVVTQDEFDVLAGVVFEGVVGRQL
jgi:hypothetical protein